ncbi:chemotaxis protein CheA [Candidatus Woesearchaeota archaeon]|nr:chemotaxis protein CheA [Candidatus Woesearchaeota archaeon]
MDKFKNEFVSEARDHLDVLNDSLLLLEKSPDDMDVINKIFRAFHTLKGNAATMGFLKFSELAHSLEDVLSRIRDGEIKVNPELMDLILEGCDIMDKTLEVISGGGTDEMDNQTLIQELKRYLDEKEQNFTVNIGKKAELSKEDHEKISAIEAEGKKIFRIIVQYDNNNPMKVPKTLVILRNLAKGDAVIKSNPDKEDIKQGRFNNEVEIIIATNKTKEEVSAVVNDTSGLKGVLVFGIDESYEKAIETQNEEKELAKAAIAKEHQEDVVKQIQSVKVDMEKLDNLMNLVGELLINNIRLQLIDKKQDYHMLKTVVDGIDRLTLDLQDEVMQIRMVPIGNIFKRFPRMVRDLAKKEEKKVNLVIEGQEIEFDRTVLDQIGDPLVHLLRNCIDHGIETPGVREKENKSQQGTIKLIARREKNNAVIEVKDDGAGINPKTVRASSIKKGIVTEEAAAKMTDKELQMLVFRPGVSTNKVITDVSGRGVGMDVVMSKMKELGGRVHMDSAIGKGTSVVMQLPLTLAIITALLVKSKGEIYALPLSSIDQTVDILASNIKTIQGNDVFVLRGKDIPIFWLDRLLGLQNNDDRKRLTLVIVNKDNQQVGIVVDSIVSQQQVLIKSLQDIVKGTRGVSGATILGDGSVCMILDIGTLL